VGGAFNVNARLRISATSEAITVTGDAYQTVNRENSFKAENTRVRDGGTITFSSGNEAGSTFRPQDSGNAVANLLLGAFTRYTETSITTARCSIHCATRARIRLSRGSQR